MNFVQRFLTRPTPTYAAPDALNPPRPFPQYEITGTPAPVPIPPPPALWDNALVNPFPPRSLVQQPTRITVTP